MATHLPELSPESSSQKLRLDLQMRQSEGPVSRQVRQVSNLDIINRCIYINIYINIYIYIILYFDREEE